MQMRTTLLSGTITKFVPVVKDKQNMRTPLKLFIPLHLVFPVMINYKYCKGMLSWLCSCGAHELYIGYVLL